MVAAKHVWAPADSSRILVVTKFRYMGDSIVATPVLRQLREAAPKAHITLLSGPATPVVLQGCPNVDEFMVFQRSSGGPVTRTLRLIRQVRAGGFDTVFLLNRSVHSAFVARAAGIRERAGFDTESRGPLLTVRVAYTADRCERDCLLDLLRAAGIPASLELPELWVSENERRSASQLLLQHGLAAGGPLVALQPGANDAPVREWGAERFAAVGSRLQRELGAQVIILGSAEERPLAERVAAAMYPSPPVLAGSIGLREALAVLSQCDLWIGNDGGMLHAAVALSRATIGIFGPTKAPRWSYDTPRHRTMVVYPENSARDAATIRRCLDAIQPDAVHAVACELLAGG